MARFAWICLGGAVGTGARYLLSGWALALLGPGFPWGTLAVNVLGSFAIGGIMHLALAAKLLGPTLRLTLTTGMLGGFTTYSAFNYETLQYLRESNWGLGLANAAAMLVLCLIAGAAGLALARWITGV
jgi:fluoride exporter